MEKLTALGIVATVFLLVVYVAARRATRQGRAEERAARQERDADAYRTTTEAVLNEKMAADELSARERLLTRRTRKP